MEMSREEAISLLTQINKILVNSNSWLENTHEPLNIAFDMAIKALEQEPILEKINKMKSEIADALEFWDYSPNNNPLARDILETVTHFWGDIRGDEE